MPESPHVRGAYVRLGLLPLPVGRGPGGAYGRVGFERAQIQWGAKRIRMRVVAGDGRDAVDMFR